MNPILISFEIRKIKTESQRGSLHKYYIIFKINQFSRKFTQQTTNTIDVHFTPKKYKSLKVRVLATIGFSWEAELGKR